MRAFDSNTLSLMAAGRIFTRGMVQFDFGTGTYGFWDGIGPLTYEGLTYVGGGSLISTDDLSFSASLSAAEVTLTLTGVANSDLTPDTLASIEAEQYHGRPVTLRRAYIHPDTMALVSVERVWRGYLDRVEHSYTIGGEAVISLSCEGRSRDNTRKGHRVWSDEDQRRIDPTDGGMRHAAVAGRQTVFWGRTPGSAKK